MRWKSPLEAPPCPAPGRLPQTSRQQHRPELIASQEHHNPSPRPGAVAPRSQQQVPEPRCRGDAFEQAPGLGRRPFLTGGIGTGHQHQLQARGSTRRSRPQGEGGVKAFRQRTHPGRQFSGSVGDKDNGRPGIVGRRSGQGNGVRMARLELARPKPHAPQTCVSTNSTTSAWSTPPRGLRRRKIIPTEGPRTGIPGLH